MPTPVDILSSLKNELKGSRSVALGQFQIINLDLIRSVAGERWTKLKTKIFDVSEVFIAKRLQPGDVVFRCDDGFLVVFAPAHAHEAEARTKAISEALNRFYLGDEIFKQFKISSRAMTLSLEELAAFFASEGVDEAQDSSETPDVVVAELPTPPGPKVVYEPVYDIEREAFISSFCLPVRNVLGETRIGHLHTYPFDAHVTADLDLALQEMVLTELSQSWKVGRKAAVCLTPHYRTLVDPGDRQKYFARLSALPPYLHSVVTVRIDGTPAGAPMGRIQEIAGFLRTMRIKFLVQCDTPAFEIERFSDCQVQAFGGVMKDASRGGELALSDSQKIQHFITRAKRLNAGTYAAAVGMRLTFEILTAMGVRWFSGPFLAPYLTKVPSSRPVALSELARRSEAPVKPRSFHTQPE